MATVHNLDDEINLDRYKQHTIEAVVDRLVISQNGEKEEQKAARTRLTDSVETALKFGEGYVSVNLVDQKRRYSFFRTSCLSRTWRQHLGSGTAHLLLQHPSRCLPGLSGSRLETGDRPGAHHPGLVTGP